MKHGRHDRRQALERVIRTARNPITPPPVFDDSWRGPDTQRGRYVYYLENNCGGRDGLGMAPADFEVLADWCSMGHIPSMRRMRQHFESRVSPEAKRRLEGYLNDASQSLFDWDEWLEARPDDCFNVRAFAFWLCRLAQFGDEAARAALEGQPRLETVAFMKLHPIKGHPNWSTWYPIDKAGSARLGLLDVTWAQGCFPTRNVEDGIIMGEEHVGDSGFDETGFGMEEEYDFFYFDDYYRLLGTLHGWSSHDVRANWDSILEDLRKKKAAFGAERAAFMALHADDGPPC